MKRIRIKLSKKFERHLRAMRREIIRTEKAIAKIDAEIARKFMVKR